MSNLYPFFHLQIKSKLSGENAWTKVKLCKEYLAYANSLTYPILLWSLKSCNARTWCIRKLIIPVRFEMASTAIEVKGYSEKEWQIIQKVGIQQLRTLRSLIEGYTRLSFSGNSTYFSWAFNEIVYFIGKKCRKHNFLINGFFSHKNWCKIY